MAELENPIEIYFKRTEFKCNDIRMSKNVVVKNSDEKTCILRYTITMRIQCGFVWFRLCLN